MQRLATTCLDEAHMKQVDFARPKWRGVILQCYMGTALETRNPLAMQAMKVKEVYRKYKDD